MDSIFSLIVNIVSCLVVYSFFDKSGFKAGLSFKLLLQLGISLINGSLIELYKLGLLHFIIILLIVFVINFITTAIEYFVYNRTNSFFTYLILGIIIEFLIVFGISFVIAFIMLWCKKYIFLGYLTIYSDYEVINALQFNFSKSFYYHMFWPVVVIGFIVYILNELKVIKIRKSNVLLIAYIFSFMNIIYYFYRLFEKSSVIYFNFTESLIYKIITILK